MKILLGLLLLIWQAYGAIQNLKRSICTVMPYNDPLLDDAPNIITALQECGDTGRIVLPVNQTFNLRSPLDLSLCSRCDFQINGVLKLSSDWDYWEKQSAAIIISNTTNIVLHGDEESGDIDASNFGRALEPGVAVPTRMPRLFSISDGSYQIHIRDLRIKNAPGTVFHVNSASSAVRFYGIDIQNAAAVGYLIENIQHVYIWNNTIHATESCVVIGPNTANVQIEDTRCSAYALEERPSSGIELSLHGNVDISWIRNIFVKGFTSTGWLNAIALIAGQEEKLTQTIEVYNATFTDVEFGSMAHQAVYLEQHETPLIATSVEFRNFKGTVQYYSNLTCAHTVDVCDFKKEGWNVTVNS